MTSVVLPDVLEPGLSVVFCGTAPSSESARRRAYYAHPGNRFWRTLHEAGFTPRQLAADEYATLPSHGIGLTDLAKHHSGQDADLPIDAFDVAALVAKIEQFEPDVLAFTSKTAARAALGAPVGYGAHAQRIGRSDVWVLPSTSGLATRYFDLGPWADLANEVRVGAGSR